MDSSLPLRVMMLISEQDLDDTIEAVSYYLEHKGSELIEVKHNRYLMLLGWLKLKKSQQTPAP